MFNGLANLKELDLNRNLIQVIETGAFKNLKNLKELTLNQNFLENVPEMINLANLNFLNLQRNQIEAILNWFKI